MKEMEKGLERDRLAKFRKQNPKGNKYKDLFHIVEIHVLGSASPCTVSRRAEKKTLAELLF